METVDDPGGHITVPATNLEADRIRREGQVRAEPIIDACVASGAGPVHEEARDPIQFSHGRSSSV
jgi:hypothetical protein